nr:uncharacterized protein LOC131772133 [Pocillopora verrucosa]
MPLLQFHTLRKLSYTREEFILAADLPLRHRREKAVFSATYFKYLTHYQDSEISVVPNDFGLLIVKPDPAEVVIHKRRIDSRCRSFTSTKAREVEAFVNERGSSLRLKQQKTRGKSLQML